MNVKLINGTYSTFLMLVMGVGLLGGCSSAPTNDSNRSRIVLSTEDDKYDMTAKVSEVVKTNGAQIMITMRDYSKNYIDVESDQYSVTVECFKESNGGIYRSGSTKGTFNLESGERLTPEFMRDQVIIIDQQCPLMFSSNR